MRDAAIDRVLDALADADELERAVRSRRRREAARGRGVAIGFKAVGRADHVGRAWSMSAPTAARRSSMNTVDMGQGSDTAMAQIVAEVLDLHAEDVRVVHPDTDVTPYDMGTLGSRSTFHMGLAVKRAAEDARDKLQALAAEAGLPPGSNVPVAEIFQKRYGMQAGNVIGSGSYIPSYKSPDPQTGLSPDVTPFWMIGGAGVEARGRHRDRPRARDRSSSTSPTPAGRSIRASARRSFPARAIMQLGFTLFEDMVFDGGQVTNASLADYKIPGIRDIPPMEIALVAAEQSNGPFGAKGIGESGTFGVSPAIANAIEDAVGVRLTDMPLTAEKVLRALRAQRAGRCRTKSSAIGLTGSADDGRKRRHLRKILPNK